MLVGVQPTEGATRHVLSSYQNPGMDSVCALYTTSHRDPPQVLDISHNQLRELPTDVGHLIYVIQLNLSKNELSLLPDSFGQMTSLQALDLSRNVCDCNHV